MSSIRPRIPPSSFHQRAAAGAAAADRADPVTSAVPDHRHPVAAEIGENQLALTLLGGGPVGRIEDLDVELALDEVHTVARRAAEAGRPDLGPTGVIERAHPEGRLDAIARRRDRGPRLPGVDRHAKR